jgi:type II secretory pathway predicted ATPase ExeA/LysM repeat protein
MYTKHYGLSSKPFSLVPNPEILFLSPNHENALTYLEYGLSEKAGFILLTGEIGTGKTTLIRYLLNKMISPVDIAVIFNTNFSADQLLSRILSEFDIPCDTTEKERHLEMLYQFLIEGYAHGRHALLIIDEAQNLTDQALEEIRMLSNLQTDDHVLLQIILVGQTELKDRLKTPGLRQLAQRIVVNYHLAPLSELQTHQYIAYRLQAAGGAIDLFSSETLQLISKHAAGIPRTINLLCDAALVYGYGDNLERIDLASVEKVINDKICLTATSLKNPPPSLTEVTPFPQPDILQERLMAIEAALSDLQYRQETNLQEVKNELISKFQGMLTVERKRYPAQVTEEVLDWQARHLLRDNARHHPPEVESHPHPWKRAKHDPESRPQRSFNALKSTLLNLPETVILPMLAFVKKWDKRTITNSYFIWILLALVPIVGLGLLLGEKSHPPAIKTIADVDASPPPLEVAMTYVSYEDVPFPVKKPAVVAQQSTLPVPVSKKAAGIHTIQSGETLSSIAERYSVAMDLIISANDLRNAHLIKIGQKLKIPAPAPSAAKQ